MKGEVPMFNHIGRKLKAIAAAWGIIGILGSVAAGILLYLGKNSERNNG